MATIFPLLLLAICPLAMLLMMRGMHKHGAGADRDPGANAGGDRGGSAGGGCALHAPGDRPTGDAPVELRELHRLCESLRVRIEGLETRLQDLEARESRKGATSLGKVNVAANRGPRAVPDHQQ